MKSKISVLLSVGLAVAACLVVLPVLTQAQEQKAQGYLMEDYVVKPSMAKQFEAATAEKIGLYAGIKFPFGWTACSSEDFHYYFFIPIGNFASIDSIYAAFGQAKTRLGENFKTLEKRLAGSYEYCRAAVVYLRPDLSYTPTKQNIKPEESNYIFFEFTYILPGQEEEFEAYYKEWAALCQKIGFPIGYAAYQGDIGTDMPFYFSAMSAKTQTDTFIEEERIMKLLSQEQKEELGATYNKAYAFFRKYETKNGQSRPDLSYTPQTK